MRPTTDTIRDKLAQAEPPDSEFLARPGTDSRAEDLLAHYKDSAQTLGSAATTQAANSPLGNTRRNAAPNLAARLLDLHRMIDRSVAPQPAKSLMRLAIALANDAALTRSIVGGFII